jgi:hypothetical protein
MNHENLIKFQLLLWSEESSLLLRSADTPYKTPSASNNSVYSLSNSPEMVQLGRNGLVARYRRILGWMDRTMAPRAAPLPLILEGIKFIVAMGSLIFVLQLEDRVSTLL